MLGNRLAKPLKVFKLFACLRANMQFELMIIYFYDSLVFGEPNACNLLSTSLVQPTVRYYEFRKLRWKDNRRRAHQKTIREQLRYQTLSRHITLLSHMYSFISLWRVFSQYLNYSVALWRRHAFLIFHSHRRRQRCNSRGRTWNISH